MAVRSTWQGGSRRRFGRSYPKVFDSDEDEDDLMVAEPGTGATTVAGTLSVTTPAQSTGEFVLFVKLPVEVQLIIWEKFKEIAGIIDMSTVKLTTVKLSHRRHVDKPQTYLFSRIRPHPLSNTCKNSRSVYESTKNFAYTTYEYCQAYNYPTNPPGDRHLTFHPQSVFLFESLEHLKLSCFTGGKVDHDPEDEIFKATAVKSLAFKGLIIDKEYKTTLKVGTEYLRDDVLYLALWKYFSLERLIFITPSWVDDPSKSRKFKRTVEKVLGECKKKLEGSLKLSAYNQDVLQFMGLVKHSSRNAKRLMGLKHSEWWKNPKVDIMSQVDFDGL